MIRRIAAAVLVLTSTSCDPFLPLKATSIVQAADHITVNLALASSATMMSGDDLTLRVDAYDAGGNLIEISRKTASWQSSDNAVFALGAPVSDGTVSGTGGKAGTATVSAVVDGKTSSLKVSVIPGLPAKVVVVSGDNQLGIVGDQLPLPIIVKGTDAYGNALGAGWGATASVPSGSLVFASLQTTTDASGQISFKYTPLTTGAQTLSVAIGGGVLTSVPESATTLAITFPASPATAANGNVMSPSPVAQLKLSSTGANYAKAGVSVTASVASSTGLVSLSGTTTVATDATGAATFTNLKLTGAAGTVTLKYTALAIGVNGPPTTLTGGTPTKLAIVTQPSTNVIAGQSFAQPAVLQLQDANGNASPTSGIQVVATASAGATTANAQATTDATGAATFSTLTVNGTVGSTFTLTFSAPSASPSVTQVATTPRLLTGIATKLLVQQTPSSAQCGLVFLTPPAVKLQDALSQDVFQSGVAVTISASGTAVIDAGASVSTDAKGLATFSGLALSGVTTGSPYTLAFASTGLAGTSTPTTGGPGSARSMAIVVQPPLTATNGAAVTQVPQVKLLDKCGNVASGAAVLVSVAAVPAVVTFTNGSAGTSAGIATFTGLSLAGKAQSYTLSFTSSGLPSVAASQPTNLLAGAAAVVALTTQPPGAAASTSVFSPVPVARIRDVGGNPVVGARTVTATISAQTPANGTIVNNSSANVASNDSTATFGSLALTGIAGSYRLIFSSSGLKPDTATVTTVLGGVGTASKLKVTTQPPNVATPAAVLSPIPVVQLVDVNDNPIALGGVTLTATLAGYSVTSGSAVTNSAGAATFSSIAFGGVPSQPEVAPTATFGATGLPSVQASNSTAIASTLTNGVAVANNGSAGSTSFYRIVVPAGKTLLTFGMTGIDASKVSFYARLNALPAVATSTYACASTLVDASHATCTVASPTAGTWYLLITGNQAYNGITLVAQTTP